MLCNTDDDASKPGDERFCGFSLGGGTASTGSEDANNEEGYWIQSPFCKHRQGSYADEVFRYLEYDRYFFVAYAGAIAGFFVATIVFFWLGGVGVSVKDSTKMTEFMKTINQALHEKSTGLATKLSAIRSASRADFLKQYRFQMFESFSALKLGDIAKTISKQSDRVHEILMKSLKKPDYTCESFETALDTSWVNQDEFTTGQLMDRAVESINLSGVLPFYTTIGEHKDRSCVEFSPELLEAIEFDLIPQFFSEKAYFCPGTESGKVSGEVLSSMIETAPVVQTEDCNEDFITKWTGFVTSLTAEAPPERKPLLNAVLFQSIKLSGSLKAPKSLSTLQGLANWVLTSRDKCAFSALRAIIQTGVGDERFGKNNAEESVLAALGSNIGNDVTLDTVYRKQGE